MESMLLAVLAGIPLVMLAFSLLPASLADAHVRGLRRLVSGLSAVQLITAIFGTFFIAFRLATDSAASEFNGVAVVWAPFGVQSNLGTVWLDGASSLMYLMVSFVGWVICRYSVQYLDGDASQGNFFRWVAFTLGAVSMMVVCGDLVTLLAAWIATSFGLHHLLLHFPDSVAAKRAAWTKFAIIRIGDVALVFSALMLYLETETIALREIFAGLTGDTINATNIQVAAVLLVIAAVVKSAQFPFHTWLPQTMQTPTPVSALMHAGIVNAGGYLIVRLHPVVVAAPWVMAVLAAFGILTVTYAAVVMTTQTSVKRTLAYSTIAQMGFMILQCGLGAFSAAMLHILAHSMYKAHAFLSSGSQIANYATPSLLPPRRESISRGRSISVQLGLFAAGVSLLFGFLMLLGVDPISKPGGLVLGAIIALAVSRWLGQMLQFGDRKTQLRSAIVSVLLLATYGFSYRCVSWFTQNADGLASTSIPVFQWVAIGSIVTLGFVLLLIVELTSSRPAFSSRLQSLYVHASNGFYMDGILRRTFGTLMSS